MPRAVKKITDIIAGEITEPALEKVEAEIELNNRLQGDLYILFDQTIARIRTSLNQLDDGQRKVAEGIISKARYILDNQPCKVNQYLKDIVRAADLIDSFVTYNFDKKLETTINKLELKLNIPNKDETLPNL